MAKAPTRSPAERERVVLSILRGEMSAMEAARGTGVTEKTVRTWQRVFLEGGRERLATGRGGRSARELELEAEGEELKAALGEAYVQIRMLKKRASQASTTASSRT